MKGVRMKVREGRVGGMGCKPHNDLQSSQEPEFLLKKFDITP